MEMNNNISQEVKHDARKIGDAAINATEGIGHEINIGARQVGTALRDAGAAVSHRDAGAAVSHNVAVGAQDTLDSIVATSRDGAAQLESKVQNSPLLAVGVAFGVGLIASSLLFRKN